MKSIKALLIGISILACFTKCETSHPKLDLKTIDTIKTNNGYCIILNKNGGLEEIIKTHLTDTSKISFYDFELSVMAKRNNDFKKYYIDILNGIYKVKHSSTDYKSLNEFQTTYIDTSASNFSIKPQSDFISIFGLRDTVSLNSKLYIHVHTFDSVFPHFNLFTVKSNENLNLKHNNYLKNKSFNFTQGISDTITFKEKGTYFYQGYIENYMITKDSMKASKFNYFRKKIIVK